MSSTNTSATGVAQLFLEVEPQTGRYPGAAGDARIRKDQACWPEGMLATRFLDAERMVLWTDDLNTHAIQSLHETVPPALARALALSLEFRPTPKHGSWFTSPRLS